MEKKPNKKTLQTFTDGMNAVVEALIDIKSTADEESVSGISFDLGWMQSVLFHRNHLNQGVIDMELEHAQRLIIGFWK